MSAKSNCSLTCTVQGQDGSLTATRDVKLPFQPSVGMSVDGLRVLRADWRTDEGRWLLTLEGYTQMVGKALDNFRRHVADPGAWEVEVVGEKKAG